MELRSSGQAGVFRATPGKDEEMSDELERLKFANEALRKEKEEFRLINENVSSHAALLENELEMKLHEITRISETDYLTKIYNRKKIYDLAAAEIERTKRYKTDLAVIILDVDHFKSINDNFGHATGDQVLLRLAGLIGGMIRKTDIFGRWGGDEFMILATHSSLAATRKLIGRIRSKIQNTASKASVKFTCSFGIAEFRNGDTLKSLVSRADEALYQSKENGRNAISVA